MTSEKNDFAQFLKNKEHDAQSSNTVLIFCEKLPIYNFFCIIKNVKFDIPQEILQSHSFMMVQKFEMKGYQWYGVKWIGSTFKNKENNETWCRALLYCKPQVVIICLNNKTDFEQSLFNPILPERVWAFLSSLVFCDKSLQKKLFILNQLDFEVKIHHK